MEAIQNIKTLPEGAERWKKREYFMLDLGSLVGRRGPGMDPLLCPVDIAQLGPTSKTFFRYVHCVANVWAVWPVYNAMMPLVVGQGGL